MAANWHQRDRSMFTSMVGGMCVNLYKTNGKPKWTVSSGLISANPLFQSATFNAKNAKEAKAKAWGVVLDAIESKVAEMRREVEAKVD